MTNLNGDGPGSLREAVLAQGPRIVVFEVGGVIDLDRKTLKISEPYLTIAGQTAPSPGITLIRGGIDLGAHDVILQHTRVRVGQAGYRVVFCASSHLVHHESFTRGVSRTDPHPADSALYRIKWKDYMKAGDPFFNPGLSLISTKWEIRRPIPVNVDIRRRIATIDRAAGRTFITFSPGKPA